MTQSEVVAWLRARFPARRREGRGRPAAMDWAGAAGALGVSVDNLMRKMQPCGRQFTRQDLLIIELRSRLESDFLLSRERMARELADYNMHNGL